MKILHLETGRHLYGGARQVLYLARGLQLRSVEQTLVCPVGSEIEAAAIRHDLPVESVKMAGDADWMLTLRLRRLFRGLEPDIVHVHSRRGADTFGGRAARCADIPAVLSRRVDNPESRVGRRKYRDYDQVIAISRAVHDALTASGIVESLITVVNSGIDPADCQPRQSWERFLEICQLRDDALVVACVAQMIPRKGHADLLDAWPAVATAMPRARLLLFGQGPLQEKLEQRVRGTRHEKTVHFAGFQPDLLGFIGHVNLLVHPAYREGLGIAVLEAQAAGVPVVAYDAGGVPEIVANGVTGRLVTAGDKQALADAVIDLLQDHSGRRNLSRAARSRASAHFGVDQMVEGNLAVYRRVLRARQ